MRLRYVLIADRTQTANTLHLVDIAFPDDQGASAAIAGLRSTLQWNPAFVATFGR